MNVAFTARRDTSKRVASSLQATRKTRKTCQSVSRHSGAGGCMLASMRFQMEVRSEAEDPLRRMAIDSHRSVREQASYLLHLKIQEEFARFKITHAEEREELTEQVA